MDIVALFYRHYHCHVFLFETFVLPFLFLAKNDCQFLFTVLFPVKFVLVSFPAKNKNCVCSSLLLSIKFCSVLLKFCISDMSELFSFHYYQLYVK